VAFHALGLDGSGRTISTLRALAPAFSNLGRVATYPISPLWPRIPRSLTEENDGARKLSAIHLVLRPQKAAPDTYLCDPADFVD
jgi:hypothetical protein